MAIHLPAMSGSVVHPVFLAAGLNCPQGEAGWMYAREDPDQKCSAAPARARA
jgi:hypothetical protein